MIAILQGRTGCRYLTKGAFGCLCQDVKRETHTRTDLHRIQNRTANNGQDRKQKDRSVEQKRPLRKSIENVY